MKTLKGYSKVIKEMEDLYRRKNADYGDSFHKTYLEEGHAMARIRLSDKLNRYITLSKGAPSQVHDESLRDTLIDLANYAVMTVVEMDAEPKSTSEHETSQTPPLTGDTPEKHLSLCHERLHNIAQSFHEALKDVHTLDKPTDQSRFLIRNEFEEPTLSQRPSKDEYHLEIARAVALRSPCPTRQYGAVLVKNDEIIATGYNGPARGTPHCDPCPRTQPHEHNQSYDNCPAVHAEMNALLSAPRPETLGSTLYLHGTENGKPIESPRPCIICTRLLINAGVHRVVTLTEELDPRDLPTTS